MTAIQIHPVKTPISGNVVDFHMGRHLDFRWRDGRCSIGLASRLLQDEETGRIGIDGEMVPPFRIGVVGVALVGVEIENPDPSDTENPPYFFIRLIQIGVSISIMKVIILTLSVRTRTDQFSRLGGNSSILFISFTKDHAPLTAETTRRFRFDPFYVFSEEIEIKSKKGGPKDHTDTY